MGARAREANHKKVRIKGRPPKAWILKEKSKMPKMKTKSGAKKRFRVTGTGKLKVAQAGKRHGMIKRSPKQIRNLRGTKTLSKSDTRIVKSYMPYAR